MKLTVEERPDLEEAEVTIRCPAIDRRVRAIMATANAVDCRLPYPNARLELVLDNGESVIASRQYAPAIKQKIGL